MLYICLLRCMHVCIHVLVCGQILDNVTRIQGNGK